MDWIIICAAGFLGGLLNAVAGGGSFITLPALMFVGVGPVAANATGTAALLPGYVVSAWRFRRDIAYPRGLSFASITTIALVGGGIGALLLLVSSRELFSALIPWLVLIATTAFVIGPRLMAAQQAKASRSTSNSSANRLPIGKAIGLLVLCILGGYFNGGLGIMLLAALGLMGQTDLRGMNGLKNIVSALLTIIAVIIYGFGGTIAISHLPLLTVAAVVGGYAGAAMAYRVSQRALRGFVITIGIILTIAFFIR